MSDSNQDFMARVVQVAGRKVAYAVERNIPLVLEDIRRQQEFFRDAEEEASSRVDLTVKVNVYRPSDNYVRLEVDSVTWATKIRRKDTDFEIGEVDADAPYLPGLDQAIAFNAEWEARLQQSQEDVREKSLLLAASELGLKVLRSCQDPGNPQRLRIIELWKGDEHGWQPTLCESEEACRQVALTASAQGHIVIDGMFLSQESIQNLLVAEYPVCCYYKDQVKVYQLDEQGRLGHHVQPRDEFRGQDSYRQQGGIESNIYYSPIGNPPQESQEESAAEENAAEENAAEESPQPEQAAPAEETPEQLAEWGADAPRIAANARKLFARGIPSALHASLADDEEILWTSLPGQPLAWHRTRFDSSKEAAEYLHRLREDGYVNPRDPQEQFDIVHQAGFNVILRQHMEDVTSKSPIYRYIHGLGWKTMQEFDSWEECKAAFAALLADEAYLQA
jgi:hypothetical protein